MTLRPRTLLLILLAGLGATACGEPCARLLDTVCKEHPRERLCRRYGTRIENQQISPEMCEATRKVFLESLEKGR